MPKTQRKKVSPNPRDAREKVLSVRFNQEELARIDAASEAVGLDRSTWVRSLALKNAPKL